jgi:hypothetical protein
MKRKGRRERGSAEGIGNDRKGAKLKRRNAGGTVGHGNNGTRRRGIEDSGIGGWASLRLVGRVEE